MTDKFNEILCRECGANLVVEDNGGNLRWGTHESWCEAKYPAVADSPARKVATQKLICGKKCRHLHTDIHSLSEDVSHCAKCLHIGIARAAMSFNPMDSGGNKSVEVVLKAPRRKFPRVVPLALYTNALERIAKLERKLEQYENGQ